MPIRLPRLRRAALSTALTGLLMVGVLGINLSTASAQGGGGGPTPQDPADGPVIPGRCPTGYSRVIVRSDDFRTYVADMSGPWGLKGSGSAYMGALGHRFVGVGFDLERPDAREMLTAVGANYDDVLTKGAALDERQAAVLFEATFLEAHRRAYRLMPDLGSIPEASRQAALIDVLFSNSTEPDSSLQRLVNAVKSKDFSEASVVIDGLNYNGTAKVNDSDIMRSGVRCVVKLPVIRPPSRVTIKPADGNPVIDFPGTKPKFPYPETQHACSENVVGVYFNGVHVGNIDIGCKNIVIWFMLD
ncbi:hypothetical protein EHYA_05525 [Embleya hyalina]|uniref:Uncharacterized protein n=2 Tax=Embleya hyalina TaxID=516124 RepID=A0A401YT76_9ACTN|nr:hypothetical protein EHYA_05525 [Embleya hyalina]